jgi:hypothetical protein
VKLWELVGVAAGVYMGAMLTVGAIWVAAGWRRPALSADQFAELLVDDPAAARTYLATRRHGPRCACRSYALPYGIAHVRDNSGLHSATRCQPEREVIW